MKMHWNSYTAQAAQQKPGYGSLALSVLLQAKKDSQKAPNKLWASAKEEFIRSDNGLSATVDEVAAFVSSFCASARLKCSECETLLSPLQIDILIGADMKRLFECHACGSISFFKVLYDVPAGVRA